MSPHEQLTKTFSDHGNRKVTSQAIVLSIYSRLPTGQWGFFNIDMLFDIPAWLNLPRMQYNFL